MLKISRILKSSIVLSFIVVLVVNGGKCKYGNCINVKCELQNSIADECHSRKEAYVLPDLDCDCCGHCATVKDVLDPKELNDCSTVICAYVSCRPESVEYCKPDQVLVPRDGLCFCCPTCMDKRVDYLYNNISSNQDDDKIYFKTD